MAPIGKHFDEIRLVGVAGAFNVKARNNANDPSLLPETEFYIIQNSGAILDLNQSATKPNVMKVTNNAISPMVQANNGVGMGVSGFAFTGGANYLNFSTNSPGGFVATSNGTRISVYTDGSPDDIVSINPSETVTVTPGSDFGSAYFSGAEIRVAHKNGTNAPLLIKFFNGATQVGPDYYTNGVDAAYNMFYSKLPFNSMTITGTGVGACVGRAGHSLKMFKGCM